MNEANIAWLAAAFDGEGSLTVYPQTQKGYTTYRPVFQIRNTCREFVCRAATICSDLGATFFKVYRDRKRSNMVSPLTGKMYEDTYHLQVRGQEAVRVVLKAVLPWLIVKRDFARDLLAFLEDSRSRARSRRPWTDTEIARVEWLRATYMPRSMSAHAIGKAPANGEVIPKEAPEGKGSGEPVETTGLSPNNNGPQERPGSFFPPNAKHEVVLEDREIVQTLGENRGVRINNGRVRS